MSAWHCQEEQGESQTCALFSGAALQALSISQALFSAQKQWQAMLAGGEPEGRNGREGGAVGKDEVEKMTKTARERIEAAGGRVEYVEVSLSRKTSGTVHGTMLLLPVQVMYSSYYDLCTVVCCKFSVLLCRLRCCTCCTVLHCTNQLYLYSKKCMVRREHHWVGLAPSGLRHGGGGHVCACWVPLLQLVDAQTLGPVSNLTLPALLAVAAFFGSVRLIDNIELN